MNTVFCLLTASYLILGGFVFFWKFKLLITPWWVAAHKLLWASTTVVLIVTAINMVGKDYRPLMLTAPILALVGLVCISYYLRMEERQQKLSTQQVV